MEYKFFSEPQEVSFFIDQHIRVYQVANLSDPPAVICEDFDTVEKAQEWITKRKLDIKKTHLYFVDSSQRRTFYGEDRYPGSDWGVMDKKCALCGAPTSTTLCDKCFGEVGSEH